MPDKPFIDVAERPDLLPPLPAGFVDAKKVSEAAQRVLQLAGATPRDVLSTFSGMTPTWHLPPRLFKIGRSVIGPNIRIKDRSIKTLLEVHSRYREIITLEGMNDAVRKELATYFVGGAEHPLAFSKSEPGKEAANLFSLELIAALNIPKSYISIHGDCILRHFPGKSAMYSKITLSKYAGHNISEGWIRESLGGYRGSAVYETYDIFDRCLGWVRGNIPKNNRAEAETTLSWLKAHQSKELAYDFEQKIFRLEPLETIPEEVFRPGEQIHTYEALNQAKDIWFADDMKPYKSFRAFRNFLVPKLLDDLEFARIFKVGLVDEVDFSEEIQNKIDSKLHTLELFFIRKMREYEQ